MKHKSIRYFLSKTISDRSSSFSIENRNGGKWLCYMERHSIIADMQISKKSFNSLMRFTSGVTCQECIHDDCDDLADEVEEALIDMVSKHNKKHGRKMHTSFVNEPQPKREMNPFVVQIFDPSL